MISAEEIRERIRLSHQLAAHLDEIEKSIKIHADGGWPGPLNVPCSSKRVSNTERDAIIQRLTDAGFIVVVDGETIRIALEQKR